MDFLNLQTTELRDPAFATATALQRGVWLSLQLHCVAVENSGIIRDCLTWTARQWLLTAGVEKEEVHATSDLWHFEGPDLHVWNYPISRQRQVEIGRGQGHHGKKGGRPTEPKNPSQNPFTPEGVTPPQNPFVAEGVTPKSKGKDKIKGKEEEEQRQESADADVDQASFRSAQEPQKKEDPAEPDPWLSIESAEARRVINQALGRDPHRALTSQEAHTLGTYASHTDGAISTAQFRALQAYLLAEPRYDCRNAALLDAVPSDSLLRKRKRYASNVIEDLPNQIDFALQWADEAAQKKERPTPASFSPTIVTEPDMWREVWPLLFDFPAPATWAAVLDMHKPLVLAKIAELKA